MVTEGVDLLDRSRRLKRFIIAGGCAIAAAVFGCILALNLIETKDAAGAETRGDYRFVGMVGAAAFFVVYFGVAFLLKKRDEHADRAKARVVKE